jgi:hypothetical protein
MSAGIIPVNGTRSRLSNRFRVTLSLPADTQAGADLRLLAGFAKFSAGAREPAGNPPRCGMISSAPENDSVSARLWLAPVQIRYARTFTH